MSKRLSLKFDPNQQFQLDAISAVVDLFDGFNFYAQSDRFTLGGDDEIIPNLPEDEELYDSILLPNLNDVQDRQMLELSLQLAQDSGPILDGAGDELHTFPSFTIEMETGTGKTYCYFRTIYELRQRYGFSKFIIVVPSIAIYEGVLKTEQITRSHFHSLYGNEQVDVYGYDGSRLNRVRIFATANTTQVMVMTVDAFNKIGNNIYKASEKLPGELKPYQYIQRTRPIVILDEPQSLDNTEKSRQAIRTLHPLFGLRYSATHRTSPNLVYRLTPVEAYRQNLVKKIEVVGLNETENINAPSLTLEKVARDPFTAQVKTLVLERNGETKEKVIKLKQGDNLYRKTGRAEHVAGFVVTEINVTPGAEFVLFENQLKLQMSGQISSSKNEVFASQIEATIETHIEAQDRLKARGIKVLSLFFIDRVANYAAEDGIIKRLFDEAFERLKLKSEHFKSFSPQQVRDGYFAKTKVKTAKGDTEEKAIDTESKTAVEREAERAAFELIMRNKERLLSFEEPVSFIFAHSALREGWDNPNVFQICTLNQTTSQIRKRQEIGRGLRLCVNQDGERVLDEDVNILTVVANDSYENFCSKLQQEYLDEGDEAPPKPTPKRDSNATRRNEIYNSTDFKEFWRKLNRKAKYRIQLDVPMLIDECVEVLNKADFSAPTITKTKGRFVITQFEVKLKKVEGSTAWLWVQTKDTDGRLWFTPAEGVPVTRNQRVGAILRNRTNNPYAGKALHNLVVMEISGAGDDASVRFTSGEEVTLYKSLEFESEQGQVAEETEIIELNYTYPVFDFIGRTAEQTHLTRATLNQVFARFAEKASVTIFRNPEGFTRTFIETIKRTVAAHVADRVEFEIKTDEAFDTEDLFPEVKKFPQKELIESGPRGLYDKTQWDSEVELKFIEKRLRADEKATIFFFKFPPKFKIDFPRIIGDYNPDWGIVRFDDGGKAKLQLVRETKGTANLERLQYAQEALKIKCAERYFAALGIDYRVIEWTTEQWWLKEDDLELLRKQ